MNGLAAAEEPHESIDDDLDRAGLLVVLEPELGAGEEPHESIDGDLDRAGLLVVLKSEFGAGEQAELTLTVSQPEDFSSA